MKVVMESLLFNDLSTTLDTAKEEELLIMRNEKEPIVVMTLDSYNELKAQAYKNKK